MKQLENKEQADRFKRNFNGNHNVYKWGLNTPFKETVRLDFKKRKTMICC